MFLFGLFMKYLKEKELCTTFRKFTRHLRWQLLEFPRMHEHSQACVSIIGKPRDLFFDSHLINTFIIDMEFIMLFTISLQKYYT